MRKSGHIQLRVTPAQKADLTRRARAAGKDLSAWMLERLAPESRLAFTTLVRSLSTTEHPSHVLAELNDLLGSLGRGEFTVTVGDVSLTHLDELRANQVAAMVETRAARLGVRPPSWVEGVPPLRAPWFATNLISLRLHLLSSSPPAFRRRNLFVDATVGDRV